MRTLGHRLLLSLALGLSCLSQAALAQQDVAVGAAGELFRVRLGSYGELFPGVTPASGVATTGDAVLVLDVVRPGSPLERLLVPNLDAPGTPSSPAVLVDRASGVAFVVWKAVIDYNNVLYLTSFDGKKWSPRVQILGNPWAPKAAPQIAVTHNSYQDVAADGSPVTRNRTILHMVWAEQDASTYETLYRPIIIDDGSYLGWFSAVKLSDLDPSPAVGSASVPAALAMAPTIAAGRDQRTVVVTFASPATGRVVAMEIDALPEELRHSADQARSVMIDIGRKLSAPARADVARLVRTAVIASASAFNAGVARSLGDQASSFITGSTTADLAVLADQTRAFLVGAGAGLVERGLRLSSQVGDPGAAQNPSGAPASQILEMDPGAESPAAGQLFQFRVASSRPAPALPPTAGDGLQLFSSLTGAEVIIVWPTLPDRASVSYEESDGPGWSSTHQLQLGDGIDLRRAVDILSQRVRN